MKKIALALALAAVSGAAMAEWVEIGETDPGTIYADPTTIRRSGDNVKMWSLFDHKTIQTLGPGKDFLSAKIRFEYDCRDERFRNLNASFHSGKMGAGSVVFTTDERDKWSPISPRGVDEGLWKMACGKK